jgi:hypothetical protein
MMHGYGEYTWKSGQKYAGDWMQGQHHGRGFISWNSSDVKKQTRYTGSFVNSFRTGLGSEIIFGIGVYSGEWKEDQRSGRGTFRWDNGCTYDGHWAEDKRHGSGLFAWPYGKRFEGRFQNDFPREGLLSEPDGTSVAVTYDPRGEIEIERDPQPIETAIISRRHYKGPRYVDAEAVDPRGALPFLDLRGSTVRVGTEGSVSNLQTLARLDQEVAGSSTEIIGPKTGWVDLINPQQISSQYIPLSHKARTQVIAEFPLSREVIAEVPAVRVVGGAVVMKLKLGLDFETAAGAEGSDKRATFERDLSQDLENASGLPSSSFRVKELSAGSVIVDILPSSVENGPDAFTIADSLARQAGQVGSRLRSGKLTRTLESISFPTRSIVPVAGHLQDDGSAGWQIRTLSNPLSSVGSPVRLYASLPSRSPPLNASAPASRVHLQNELGLGSTEVVDLRGSTVRGSTVRGSSSEPFVENGRVELAGNTRTIQPDPSPVGMLMSNSTARSQEQLAAMYEQQQQQQHGVVNNIDLTGNPRTTQPDPSYAGMLMSNSTARSQEQLAAMYEQQQQQHHGVGNNTFSSQSRKPGAHVSTGSAPLMLPALSVSSQPRSKSVPPLEGHRKIGMLLVRHAKSNDPQAVVVENILDGSCAAESHPKIQEGDKLLCVNGKQVGDMPLEDVRAMFHFAQLDILVLKLQRGDMSYVTVLRRDPVSEGEHAALPTTSLSQARDTVVFKEADTYSPLTDPRIYTRDTVLLKKGDTYSSLKDQDGGLKNGSASNQDTLKAELLSILTQKQAFEQQTTEQRLAADQTTKYTHERPKKPLDLTGSTVRVDLGGTAHTVRGSTEATVEWGWVDLTGNTRTTQPDPNTLKVLLLLLLKYLLTRTAVLPYQH